MEILLGIFGGVSIGALVYWAIVDELLLVDKENKIIERLRNI